MSGLTNDQSTPPPGHRLIRLYPARYRAAHGEDVAATFADTVEGQPARVVRRERRDLVTHALRLRFRIGPTDPAGRVLAGAAPIQLALAAGVALYRALPQFDQLVRGDQVPSPMRTVLHASFELSCTVPWLLALAFALLGRWRTARLTGWWGSVLSAALAVPVYRSFLDRYLLGEMAALTVLACTALVLAPAGLVDVTQRGRRRMVGVALGTGIPMIVFGQYGIDLIPVTGVVSLPVWMSVVVAVVLLGELSGRRPDPLVAVGVALATVPWVAPYLLGVFDGWVGPGTALTVGAAWLTPIGAAVAVAGLVRLVRRVRSAEPSDPA
ncbi:hypothetical protein OHV05_26495 [Kitasatospora sp. NBC_00070]|uniref:hypothetical protein n=1 Tax=Kitasatospora sp. NBC_00070 TaxID=2975962 RepID=UPI00324B1290